MGDDDGFRRRAKTTEFYFSADLDVHEIARYYQISALEGHQRTKLKKILDDGKWTPQTFVDIVSEVLDSTDDEVLLGPMADTTVIRLPSLAEASVLGQIEKHHSTFLVEVLNACSSRLANFERESQTRRNVNTLEDKLNDERRHDLSCSP